MKNIVLLSLVLLFCIVPAATAAPKEISVYLDGMKLQFSSKPFQTEGTTLVPFRAIFEALDADISYNSKTKTVKATKEDVTIQLILGQTVAFRNGDAIKLFTKPRSVSGVTFVPLRFISESFGCTIGTSGNQIFIKSPPTAGTPTPAPTPTPTQDPSTGSTPPAQSSPKALSKEEVGKLSNRVVYIEVFDGNGRTLGSGSGVVIGSEGEIITNYHVIDEAASVRVDFNDERSFTTSTLLIQDPQRDLALLKIPATGLPAVTIGNSSTLDLGEEVVAIGSPLGFKNSLTSGEVSTTSRMVDGHNFIQISTPIDHGSSGGALFNMQGELVGITSAGVQSSAAINLAIPSNDVTTFLAKSRSPQALSVPKQTASKLSAAEMESYLNANYNVLTYEDLKLSFKWMVIMSDEGDRYLIGGTMYDGTEWADWIDYQIEDRTVWPSMLYYMSEELRTDLGVTESFFTLYLNTHFDFYPSAFPAGSIKSEYPGYRLDYNFIYGSMDYSTGYLHFNLTPEDPNQSETMRMQ
ncbi:trypsin-like peptidase domain-containing protein [Cohnella kolymensis]|uniref:trypsin-like peptidase domain-containing protein n=1 Tax=Cohnella kolymensis TaxID=1590652 RepID=UPI00069751D7|nr:trypsin-like peptidase domain-containing protein [Cohnella kolymensis]